MKKYFILFFIILLSISSIHGQNIICNKAYFSVASFVDSMMVMHVKLDLKSDLSSDTINLLTTVKYGSPSMEGTILAPHNICAYEYNNKKHIFPSLYKNTSSDIPLSDTQNIIITKVNRKHINVEYDVIGLDFIDNLLSDNVPFIYSFHSEQECIYPMNIPYKEINVSAPDSFYIKKNLDCSNPNKSKIDITLISKNYVNIDTLQIGKLKLILYNINRDSKINYSDYKHELVKAMSMLSNITPINGEYDILRVLFRFKEGYCAGHSMGKLCMVDKDIDASGTIHELLHSFFYNTVKPESKGQYFVSECIIEWLSQYLYGKEFDLKWKKVCKTPIYDLEADDSNTFSQIYGYGLKILYEAAKNVGLDTFASNIIMFLIENKGKETDYDSFLNFLKGKIPINIVNLIDKRVKGI